MCVSIFSLGLFFYLDTHTAVTCPNMMDNSTTTTTSTMESTTTCTPVDGFDPEVMDKIGWLPLVSLIVYKVKRLQV